MLLEILMFEIVQAHSEEVYDTLALFEDCAHWLRERGLDAGPPGWVTWAKISEQIARGSIYLAKNNNLVLGTLRLETEDPDVWGDMPDDSVYVHGLAVRRNWSGRGIGRRMLEWCEQRAVAAGKSHVRLDCCGNNWALQRYYKEAGFTYMGPSRFKDHRGVATALFEKVAIRHDPLEIGQELATQRV